MAAEQGDECAEPAPRTASAITQKQKVHGDRARQDAEAGHDVTSIFQVQKQPLEPHDRIIQRAMANRSTPDRAERDRADQK